MNARLLRPIILAIPLCCVIVATSAADDWVSYSAKSGPGAGKHIVFLSGDEEYRSEEGLPMLAKILSQRHGFRCTVLFAVDKDGTINPDNQTSLPGAEALDSADAVVMLLRYRAWPDEQMKHFVDAYQRGIPIIGLRTATHAFNYPKNSTTAYKSYNTFGKRVLGEEWVNHWGKHKKEATRGIIEGSAVSDPILRGVSEVFGNSDVYEAYPPADVKILMRGQVLTGMNPTDPPATYQKKNSRGGKTQGINEPMMPIAWTRLHKNETGKVNRVFCTTMGASTDLQNEGLRRMIVNAVYWGLDMEVPTQADVKIVGDYKPTMYGFKGYKKGVKPADHVLIVEQGKEKPQAGKVPTDWIDPDTGHRIVRLSPDSGASSLYFHQQSYTEKGDKIIVTAKGLATIDLTNIGKGPTKLDQVLQGKGTGNIILGKKTRQTYYITGGALWATHIDTKVSRELAKLPKGYGQASGLALNADETLVSSTADDPEGAKKAKKDDGPRDPFFPPAKGTKDKMTPGGRSKVLFTVNTQTGEIKKLHFATDWLNHTQFSPTDPQQLLFCHEGTWDYVNRTWAIRADGTGLKQVHQRTMMWEIAGHEFFSFDGKMIYYDLQTPRSTQFWLAGFDIKTGERIRYPIERQQWSVHFNQSHDGKLFAGDGGGPNSVANRAPKDGSKFVSPGNGQWIYLFTPKNEKSSIMKVGPDDVKIGKFEVEKLVNMSKHEYGLEPNVTFTPDNKWVVFRSNMHGATHVYAVEVKKVNGAK